MYLLGNGNANSFNINQSVHDMLITNCFDAGALLDRSDQQFGQRLPGQQHRRHHSVPSFTVNGD